MNAKPVSESLRARFAAYIESRNHSLVLSTTQGMVTLGRDGERNSAKTKVKGVFAICDEALVIASRDRIQCFKGHHEIAASLKGKQRFDAAFFHRLEHITGNVDVCDIAWTNKGICIASRLFSCLATLDQTHSIVPFWKPDFVAQLVPQSICGLSGMAIDGGEPAFATCGKEPASGNGAIIDVRSQEIVCAGLDRPSKPRLHDDRLYLIEEGERRILRWDLSSRKLFRYPPLPGEPVSLAILGSLAIVGINRVEETSMCSMVILDLDTERFELVEIEEHCEILDIQLSPYRNPAILESGDGSSNWIMPSIEDSQTKHPKPTPKDLFKSANNYHRQGDLGKAVEAYQQAIKLNADNPHIFNGLGNVYQQANREELAIEMYQSALAIDERYAPALQNLGNLLKEQGRIEECQQVFEKAQAIERNPVITVLSKTLLPPVYESKEDLDSHRRKLLNNLEELNFTGLKVDVESTVVPTNFYSVYQGQNDVEIQMQYSQLFKAPQIREFSKRPSDKRLKVGFISNYFRNHTIGRLNIGLIENLPQEKFETYVFTIGRNQDSLAARFERAAENYVPLPGDLKAIRHHIASSDLDVLMFTDIGMDPLTTTLARSRMAPVQCTTWGHPITTGMESIDYFISSEHLETPGSDEHYSEKLVRMSRVGSYYSPPAKPPVRTKQYFGLDKNSNIYLCFQNLFKIHPEFDLSLAQILKRDPKACIVMMQGKHDHWTRLLQRRFSRTLGPDARVVFLPPQPHEDFLALNQISEVSLDPFHFGGGNTSYEAFAVGLPVVTMPSEFLRCRITHALYHQMGITECTAQSIEQYVDIAISLGTDRTKRMEISDLILDRIEAIFHDSAVIEEYTNFFCNLKTQGITKQEFQCV